MRRGEGRRREEKREEGRRGKWREGEEARDKIWREDQRKTELETVKEKDAEAVPSSTG